MQRSRKRKLRKLDESRLIRQGIPLASGFIAAMTGVQVQAQDSGGVGEIIVTATKREERLQDVPLAIQAIGTEQLEQLQVSDFDDYVKYLPNVSYQQLAPGFARIFMRGVSSGDNGNHSGPLPTVGVYLDEQPVTTIQGPLDIHIYDIARVETLAGPQGTLYGASSQAGTIRIITNKPDTSKFDAAYNVEVNTISKGDAGYEAEGFVNVPVSDAVAARVVGWYRKEGGYIDNVAGTRTYPTLNCVPDFVEGCESDIPGPGTFTNEDFVESDFNETDTVGARAALRIELGDNWTITPMVMMQNTDTEGAFFYDKATGDLEVVKYYPESSTDDWYQAALTIEGRISDWTVTYAGAYLDRDSETESDYSDYALAYDNLYFGSDTSYGEYFFNDDGDVISPAEYIQGQDFYKKYSQELRITSPDDNRWRVTAGLFYQKQEHEIEQRYIVDDLAASISVFGWEDTWWLTQQEREDEDKAIFGEVSFDILDNLTVTAGGRFFESDNSLVGFFGFGYNNTWTSRTGEIACPGVVRPDGGEGSEDIPPTGDGINGGPCTNLDASVDDTDHTEKLNVSWKVTNDALLYATYATGYRPGGVNRRNDPGFGPYKRDILESIELGWKTSWADGTLVWNGAFFWQTWDNFQFSFLGANGLTNITNAQGGASIDGVETELTWAPVDGLLLKAAMMYVNPELDGDFCEQAFDDDGNPFPVEDCAPEQFAESGTTLPVTPEFKANVQGRYEFQAGAFDAHVQGTAAYEGSRRAALLETDNQLLGGSQQSYTVVDFVAGFGKDDSWMLELYVDNLFDERTELYRTTQCDEGICTANAGFGGVTYTATTVPRTIGLRFGQKF